MIVLTKPELPRAARPIVCMAVIEARKSELTAKGYYIEGMGAE